MKMSGSETGWSEMEDVGRVGKGSVGAEEGVGVAREEAVAKAAPPLPERLRLVMLSSLLLLVEGPK